MAVEVCAYRLNLRGKPIGSHVLRTQVSRYGVELEARLMLQGSLGQSVVTQTSSLEAGTLLCRRFRELTQEGQEKRVYELDFDEASGLVRASSGKARAEVPYSRPYRDPLGLLHFIRYLGDEVESLRVPMLGKDVLIERLPDVELSTGLGSRQARAYLLSPGPGYVYVDVDEPRAILKLSQRLEAGLLDALIVKVSQEEEAFRRRDERSKRRKGRGGRRRTPRRRRDG
jgi:hypothetical protein